MSRLRHHSKVLLAVAAILFLGTAQAHVITGNLWHVPEAAAQNAIAANLPATPPDVSFDVNSPFSFNAGNASVQAWLDSGGAFNIVENTAGALASPMDDGIFGTLLRFTGWVTVMHDQTFTITHDDGVTLAIGGLDLVISPGPTNPYTSLVTYTGPSGTHEFELVYGECCGGAAVLQVDLPFANAVPEPGTLLLLGGSLLGLSLRSRRHS